MEDLEAHRWAEDTIPMEEVRSVEVEEEWNRVRLMPKFRLLFARFTTSKLCSNRPVNGEARSRTPSVCWLQRRINSRTASTLNGWRSTFRSQSK
ncbi:hypothetical protein PMAYCL1PPCAC_04193 [Pristionchus mayeri]|uniref:Uncharacterized protein n=1 Tax=Pristionchus mayeri TaxID=1317129 RepID=A0AAN4Z4A5_9BILA|nr:hypothetical protein PMAYCL1PPCAC_04193 [Pristionchus mayeri]